MSTPQLRVAMYARVSTTNHGQDAGLQTRELHQFALARGWQIVGEYVDAGIRTKSPYDRRTQATL
jgi:DNA invertase Pin-like site-specific DNA recombinase